MNHPFIRSVWSDKVCAKCAMPASAHTESAECESCGSVTSCNKIDGMLLCITCETKHNDAKNVKVIEPEVTNEQKLIDQINLVANSQTVSSIANEAIRGNINQYSDYFNASIISIKELEVRIASDDAITEKQYELARILNSRIKHLTRVLFDLKSLEVEASAEIKSIQQYVTEIIPKLRKDLREQYAKENPSFIPQVTGPKSKIVRKSAEDKLAESYAKLMKISVEEAKRKMANKLRDDCCCATMPGLCKVHN